MPAPPDDARHPRVAERAAICLLERGDRVALHPIDAEDAVTHMAARVEPGFDHFRDALPAAVRALAAGGAWRLTLSATPARHPGKDGPTPCGGEPGSSNMSPSPQHPVPTTVAVPFRQTSWPIGARRAGSRPRGRPRVPSEWSRVNAGHRVVGDGWSIPPLCNPFISC